MLNKNIKVFVIYITFLLIIAIYPTKNSQITYFFIKKIIIFNKYLDFMDIF